MGNSTIVMIVAVLLVLVVTGMIAFLISNGKSSRKKRTLSVIKGENFEEQAGGRKSQDLRREKIAHKLRAEKEELENEKKKKQGLPDMIIQAGLDITVKRFWAYSAIFSVVATGIVFILGAGPFLILTTLIITFLGLPRLSLKRMAQRRQKLFLHDLADVFESMVRLLKAGMPVSEAIKMVAREFTGPVGEEMGRIFDKQKIGVSLAEATLECSKRIPLPEVQMFATAVSIQAQTGSSLSEILENLARVVRSRFRLKRKIQALSSEAKASAMIIGALPIFVAVMMYFLNREYIIVLFEEKMGKILLTGAAIWMGLGILTMKQMINFKI